MDWDRVQAVVAHHAKQMRDAVDAMPQDLSHDDFHKTLHMNTAANVTNILSLALKESLESPWKEIDRGDPPVGTLLLSGGTLDSEDPGSDSRPVVAVCESGPFGAWSCVVCHYNSRVQPIHYVNPTHYMEIPK